MCKRSILIACLLGSVDCRSLVRESGNHPDGDRARGLVALLMAADPSSGFAMSRPALSSPVRASRATPQMTSRREMLGAVTGLGMAALARSASAKEPIPVEARIVEKSALSEPDVQDALVVLRGFKPYASDLQAQWRKDPKLLLSEKIADGISNMKLKKTLDKLYLYDDGTQEEIEEYKKVIQTDLDVIKKADKGNRDKNEIEKGFAAYLRDLDKLLSYYGDGALNAAAMDTSISK